jgi:flagellar biosynthesis anti-sigma factor FlgM
MKIDNNALNLNPSLQAAQASRAQASGKARHGHLDSNGSSADSVQLSDLASQLTALASSSDDTRVSQLKASYEAGTYNVTPHQIAAGMLDYMRNE